MARKVRQKSPWFRRFMVITALIIVIVAIVGFSALSKQNFALAFPLFVTAVVLMIFEFILMFFNNRQ